MTLSRNFSFNQTLLLSVLLHGVFFVVGLSWPAPTVTSLPVGVELSYAEVPAVAPRAVSKAASPVAASKITTKEVRPSEPLAEAAVPVAESVGVGSSSAGATAGSEGVAGGAKVTAEERFLYEVRILLEKRKRYPVMAKKLGQSGKVTMRFTLAADGSLLASEFVDKAPYDLLNKAASELVQGIDGLKPIPQELQRTSWVITVPIDYVL